VPPVDTVTGADHPVGFGVIAPTSTVARKAVIPAILESGSCRLVGVASRSDPGGERSSPRGARPHARYEEVLGDPEVEAVYIPLPNSMHREWVERSAAAGKHVLCEKPLATSAADAAQMSASCRDAGVVLMEAYMSPFHPRSRAIREMTRSGELGRLLFGAAAFTGVLEGEDDYRWRPEMGGGALLDVGIYCLSPLLEAARIAPLEAGSVHVGAAAAHYTDRGVDASFSGWLDFGDATTAVIQCSAEAPERQLLELVGTEAALSVERPFTPSYDDVTINLRRRDGTVDEVTTAGGNPYLGMVDHFCDLVRGRATPERPPEHSIALAELIDRLAEVAREQKPEVRP
jgi:xylose dehydrogenase (NAD/NADP)